MPVRLLELQPAKLAMHGLVILYDSGESNSLRTLSTLVHVLRGVPVPS